MYRLLILWAFLAWCFFAFLLGKAHGLPYDLMFVSSPRLGGDTTKSKVPDAVAPLALESGTHLMLLRAGQAQPEVFVDAGAGAVSDPFASYDGTQVYYSLCADMSPTGVNGQRHNLPKGGCDIYVKPIAGGPATKLVGQDVWHPNASMGVWSTRPDRAEPAGTQYLGYGIINLSPVPLPNGDIFFVSNLAGYDIIQGFAHPSMQGYILHADTGHIEQFWFPPTTIWPGTLLSQTGELVVGTLENAQFRDKSHFWGIWAMLPDGRAWRPLFSATMNQADSRHFHTEWQGNLVTTTYYIGNNAGLGTLLSRPLFYGTTPSAPEFGSFVARKNPAIPMGNGVSRSAYTPAGTMNLAPMLHTFDIPAAKIDGAYTGKIGFPWAAPDGVLLSYSAGPAHTRATPMPQLGIYLLPRGEQLDAVSDLQVVYDNPQRNEFYARPVVPYRTIYGVDAPKGHLTRPPNDGTLHPSLPPGTPYALIGTSSVWHRESCGGQFLPGWECASPVYAANEMAHSNRRWQGTDTHKFRNDDIWAMEIVAQSGVSHLSYGPGNSGTAASRSFVANGGNERFVILGQIPLYKKDQQGNTLLDPMGNPDTSFLARIPADTSFGFRLVNKDGMVLTQPGTWHQLRPGEVRTDCGGCHAHSQQPLAFGQTAAGKSGFQPTDLTKQASYTREFARDIAPILHRHCVGCHDAVQQAGRLDLLTETRQNGIPRNALLLIDDKAGALAGPKPIGSYVGRASRYVAPFAAAESLLAWVVTGRRLDGVDNAARPTESTPGDATTLPPGAHPSAADIDYRPEVHKAHARLELTSTERQTIVQWIDLGMPVDIDPARGWLVDEWKPTIAWGEERCDIVIGLHDVGSGLDMTSLAVIRDGQALKPSMLGDGRWRVSREAGRYMVSVKDLAGNRQVIVRRVR